MNAKHSITPQTACTFARDQKGAIIPNRANISEAIRHPDICKYTIELDNGEGFAVPVDTPHSARVRITKKTPGWQLFGMLIALEKYGFRRIPFRIFRDELNYRVADLLTGSEK